jgi:RND family efflux transporter MFP subunit
MRALVMVIVMSAAVLTLGCKQEAEEAFEDVRPVRAVTIGQTGGTVGATYSGEIRARYESKLGFRNGGKVVERLVEVGTRVRPGQPLLRQDPEDVALTVVSATAEVEAARSRVTQDRVDLERSKQLFAKRFVSQAEVDRDQLALDQAESQLKAAEAQLKMAANRHAYATLSADMAGVVTAINVEVGQVVAAGQTVLTIAAHGEREVVISIPEARVDEFRNAKKMTVTLWASPGKVYNGRLRELAPDTDEVTRTYAARVTVLDPDASLLLGMTASVHVPDVQGSTAVRLPMTAVYDNKGRPLVWVVDPRTSQVAQRFVTLAAAEKDTILIAEGLKDGEVVVTAGVHMLHEGQKVQVVDAPSAPVGGAAP